MTYRDDPTVPATRSAGARLARSGETCPESGVWGVVDDDTNQSSVLELGSIMPTFHGKKVTWWLRY